MICLFDSIGMEEKELCTLLAILNLLGQIFSSYTGGNPENLEREDGTLGNYIDTIYFTENPLKIIQNFMAKGVATVHSASPP